MGGTDMTYLCSVYYFRCAQIVSKAAGMLGETELCREYDRLAGKSGKPFSGNTLPLQAAVPLQPRPVWCWRCNMIWCLRALWKRTCTNCRKC